jgi:hypothetical protein
MLIVGACVSVAASDNKELPPTVAEISRVVAPQLKAILIDSGFYSDAAVQAVKQNPDGTPTGVTVFAAVERTDDHKTALRPQEPRRCGLKPQAEPLPGRTTVPVASKSVPDRIPVRSPRYEINSLGFTHCHP